MFVVGRVGYRKGRVRNGTAGYGTVVIQYDRLRKCIVGCRYDRLRAVCSRIGQEVFIRYDRLR